MVKAIDVDFKIPPAERGANDDVRYSIMGLLLETFFWAGTYSAALRYLVPVFKRLVLDSRAGDSSSLLKEGTFLRSNLDESTFSFLLSFHHVVSASLMVVGYVMGSSSLWLHGIALEMGYEIVDTVALITDSWPYSALKNKFLKFLPLAHHLPTLAIIPILTRLGYHDLPDVQKIGWSLIGAGGIGFFTEGLKKTLDRDLNTMSWLAIHLTNLSTMIVLRGLVFPIAAIKVLDHMKSDERTGFLYPVSLIGAISLTVFNAALIINSFFKTVKPTRRLAAMASRRAYMMPQKTYNVEPVKQS